MNVALRDDGGGACGARGVCGVGEQEANLARRMCLDKPRLLLSTVLKTRSPDVANFSEIGLTRAQILDGNEQVLPALVTENDTTPLQVG